MGWSNPAYRANPARPQRGRSLRGTPLEARHGGPGQCASLLLPPNPGFSGHFKLTPHDVRAAWRTDVNHVANVLGGPCGNPPWVRGPAIDSEYPGEIQASTSTDVTFTWYPETLHDGFVSTVATFQGNCWCPGAGVSTGFPANPLTGECPTPFTGFTGTATYWLWGAAPPTTPRTPSPSRTRPA